MTQWDPVGSQTVSQAHSFPLLVATVGPEPAVTLLRAHTVMSLLKVSSSRDFTVPHLTGTAPRPVSEVVATLFTRLRDSHHLCQKPVGIITVRQKVFCFLNF